MRHFTHLADLGVEGVARLLQRALELKARPQRELFDARVLAMLFFNPSLRTRVSFETAMLRGGGSAVVLNAGQDTWKLEDRPGAVMDADRPEHLRDAIPVLCGYVDGLAVRCFAGISDRDADEQDGLLRQIRELATVPVISMESAREHPCQGLADMLTVLEGGPATGEPTCAAPREAPPLRGRKLTLTWAPHIKPLPLAVPHSFLLTAAACGADLTVAHPQGFELHPAVLAEAARYAECSGARIAFTRDQRAACAGAEVVYAKSWAPVEIGNAGALLSQHAHWLCDLPLLTQNAVPARFMHCLPVRRNVEVSDAVLDSPLSLTVPEAHNRYFVQVAALDLLLNGDNDA
jgi:N-acetylornithine carbamoyltransferase